MELEGSVWLSRYVLRSPRPLANLMLVPRLCIASQHMRSPLSVHLTLSPSVAAIPETSCACFFSSTPCIPHSTLVLNKTRAHFHASNIWGPISPPAMNPYVQYYKLSFSQVSRCRRPYDSTTSSNTPSFHASVPAPIHMQPFTQCLHHGSPPGSPYRIHQVYVESETWYAGPRGDFSVPPVLQRGLCYSLSFSHSA